MNISTKATLSFATAIAIVVGASSCKKDDDPIAPPHQEELITTLLLHFASQGGSENKTFNFTDLDGDGGNAPVILADTLSADTVYNVTIEVLNESESPAEDITQEIEDEGDDHQFFFLENNVDLDFSYQDVDNSGNPIGLSNTCAVGAVAMGTLTVVLRHQPDKNAAGVSGGDISNAGGETDNEVEFSAIVE